MATYIELHSIRNDQDIVRKVHVAMCDVAYDILAPEAGTTQARQDWAKATIKNPESTALQIVHFVLIANKAATPAQIIAATDAGVKTAVQNAVTKLIGATA